MSDSRDPDDREPKKKLTPEQFKRLKDFQRKLQGKSYERRLRAAYEKRLAALKKEKLH